MYFLQMLRLLHDTIGLPNIIGKHRTRIDDVVAVRWRCLRIPRGTRRGLGAPWSLAFLGAHPPAGRVFVFLNTKEVPNAARNGDHTLGWVMPMFAHCCAIHI